MPNRELLHSRRARSTSGAAPHAIRARRCALLHFQVWEFSDEASIGTVPRLKSFNLFVTLLPVHWVVLDRTSGKRDVPKGKLAGRARSLSAARKNMQHIPLQIGLHLGEQE